MGLSPGSRFGVFDIIAVVGQGGMGQVFRARDTKLERDVALKVLPEELTADADRLGRLRREAQILASLNHPNVAHAYGLEEAGGVHAIVMEFVDGQTLADRVRHGPLAAPDVLGIAKQVADALETAHERGVVHRDLKPANVKVRADGVVKILDFGLAKALDPQSMDAGDAATSPTLSLHATRAGVILGTAAYMSPEQARGAPAGRLADVWAFGALLYEMLSGRRAFDGATISDTLASVLKTDPDWTALASAPEGLQHLVKRCLTKDPRRRLQSIGEARVEIEDLASGASESAAASRPAPPRAAAWRRVLPWAIAAAAVAAAITLAWTERPRSAAKPLRVSVDLGADRPLTIPSFGSAVVLSPDSAHLAFVAQGEDGSRQLAIRQLSQLRATLLPGTDDADSPFFSPDGRWIGFFANGKLKKVSVTGGSAFTICDAPNGRGGAWDADGTIVFSPDGRDGVVLVRVPSDGGTPQAVTTLNAGENNHRWPQLLPNGKGVLFTAQGAGSNSANLVVQTVPAGQLKVVHRGGSYGRYLPSGHLVFLNDGALVAVPFDLDRLEATGSPVRLIDGLMSNVLSGGAQFDVSLDGMLVYRAGQSSGGLLPMQWMDRNGTLTLLRATPAAWFGPRFDTTGDRIALQVGSDIWVYEWQRDTLTPLTSGSETNSNAVWSPDGRRVAFASASGSSRSANVYWRVADGTRDAERLTRSEHAQAPMSWHPNGRFLVFEERSVATASDVMILPMDGGEASGWKPGQPRAFLNGPHSERDPMFSPDGRWIAYSSNESGRYDVYVRPFSGSGVWQISTGGGSHPTWSRTALELFYEVEGRIMMVPYRIEGDSFRADQPRLLAETRVVQRAANRMFDLHPSGDRFLLAADTEAADSGQRSAILVDGFFDELRRLAPPSGR